MSGLGTVHFWRGHADKLLRYVKIGHLGDSRDPVYCQCGAKARSLCVALRSDLVIDTHPLAPPWGDHHVPKRMKKDPNPGGAYRFVVAACSDVACDSHVVVYHHEAGMPQCLRDAVAELGGRVEEVARGALFRHYKQLEISI